MRSDRMIFLFLLFCVSITKAVSKNDDQFENFINLKPSLDPTVLQDERKDSPFPTTDSPNVLALLKKYELNYAKIFETHKELELIQKTEKVLKLPNVQADIEFSLSLYQRLAVIYMSKTVNDYDKALEILKKAETLAIVDKKKYKNHLAMIYNWMTNVFMGQKKYNDAIEVWKIMAEEYQGVGFGKFKNLLASTAVSQVARFSLAIGQDSKTLKEYLSTVSAKFSNEVGCAALTELYDLEKKEGNESKANDYLKKLQSFPKTWEYQNISAPVVEKWENIKLQKNQKK